MTDQNGLQRASATERGVEWEDCGNGATYVEHNGEAWRFDYDEPFDQLGIVCLSGYTPEQAVAATLGETPTPHVEDLGRLHDELRDAIVEILGNRCDWDQAGVRHAHEVLERAATLGRGTCHPVISDNLAESEGTGDAWADCSECGHLLFVLTDPSSQPPNYCLNCGRRVV